MKVNMLDAKNNLSRLVKEALEGKEVVIASNGEPMVRLVPVTPSTRLRGWGSLRKMTRRVDAAFSPDVDAEVARQVHGGE